MMISLLNLSVCAVIYIVKKCHNITIMYVYIDFMIRLQQWYYIFQLLVVFQHDHINYHDVNHLFFSSGVIVAGYLWYFEFFSDTIISCVSRRRHLLMLWLWFVCFSSTSCTRGRRIKFITVKGDVVDNKPLQRKVSSSSS